MAAPQPDSMRGPSVKTLLLLLLLLSALTCTVFCQNDEDADGNTENPDYAENPGDTGNPDDIENPHDTENQGETENPDATENLGDTEDPVDDVVVSVLHGSEGGDDSSAAPPEDLNGVSDTSPSGQPGTGDGDSDLAESGSGIDSPDTDPWSTSDPETQDLTPIIILIPVALAVLIISMIVLGIFISRRMKKQTRKQEFQKEDPYLDSPSEEKVPMPMFEEDVPSVLELEMEELDQWMKKDSEHAGESTQT